MNQPHLKCVILVASATIGGSERYLVELATAMSRSQARPTVVNLKSFVAYKSDLVANNVPVYAGLADHRWNPLGAIRLIRLLMRLKPDVLFINSNRQAMWLGAISAKFCRIPLVLIHTHDHLDEHVRSIKAVAARTDGVIAASRSHRATLCREHGLPPNRVHTIYPGIDLRRTQRQDRGPERTRGACPVIGIVAALRPEKDHETFLHAAALVKKQVPETRFRVVGDGPRKPALQALARDLGIGDSTEFTGWQTVDSALFSELDLLVLCSTSETFPAVILESFSAGVPVVATDVGSVSELLTSPERGVLVRPRDPAALSEAIVQLLKNPDRIRLLREQALRHVGFYTADRFCADTLRTFEQVKTAKAHGFPSAGLERGELLE